MMFIRTLGKTSALILIIISLSVGVVFAGSTDTMSGKKLGCQKNNPGRLDCSSLEVTAVCEGSVAVFTIRNTGEAGDGNMVSATDYRLVVDGAVIETGSVQLIGGTTMQVSYAGGGTVTLEADQQVGHPGNSQPRATLTCGAATATDVPVTEEPTAEPTVVVTDEPTQEPTVVVTEVPTEVTPTEAPTEEPTVNPEPELSGEAFCYDGSVEFVVTNTGSDMGDSTYYYTLNDWGYEFSQGWLWLAAGQSESIWVTDVYDNVTLYIDEYGLVLTAQCAQATDEVTAEGLVVTPLCGEDSMYLVFSITNHGDDMYDSLPYTITLTGGEIVEEGWLYLSSGETTELIYPGWYGALVLEFNGGSYYASCLPEEPTEEPTVVVTEEPTAEPTVVVTDEPTAEPTVVVTEEPTAEPTVVATEEPTTVPTATPSDGPLGCQGNNPDRLDCSSLEVTVVCVGNTAVFTITNTGEAGNGDMRAPTEYRLLVNNQLIKVGDVLLTGGASMQITSSSGGRTTLEADQQVGHPGTSQPRATATCK